MLIIRPDSVRVPDVEDHLKKVLRTSLLLPVGHPKGGCISQGHSYQTDHSRVFVKINHRPQARIMFDGEVAGLEAIRTTGTVRVPEPITVTELPGGGVMLIMEHLEMRDLSRFAGTLGEQLADLHLHNMKLKKSEQRQRATIGKSQTKAVEKFGFHMKTCCGYIPQVNDWQDDWLTFFTKQRLQPQLDLIEMEYGDRTARELWSELQIKVSNAFKDTHIFPSLLHGDLWEANVGEDEAGPLLFDPGCFYGHSEYELAIGEMFGDHRMAFYLAYHRKIPKAHGFDTRLQLYQLFHSLNNWNHFGLQHRSSSISLMRALLEKL
ncbi:fructosamine-3-kinase-like [Discoglossus pictus]